jgi:transcriptional regulator with XRE-family HTH domain
MEDERDFGVLLHELCEARGYSLRELARRVGGGTGKDATYLGRLEKGTYRPPRMDTIHSLATALELSPAEEASLLRASGHLPPTLAVAPAPLAAPELPGRGAAGDLRLPLEYRRREAAWKVQRGEPWERLAPVRDLAWGAVGRLAEVLTDKGGAWPEARFLEKISASSGGEENRADAGPGRQADAGTGER